MFQCTIIYGWLQLSTMIKSNSFQTTPYGVLLINLDMKKCEEASSLQHSLDVLRSEGAQISAHKVASARTGPPFYGPTKVGFTREIVTYDQIQKLLP